MTIGPLFLKIRSTSPWPSKRMTFALIIEPNVSQRAGLRSLLEDNGLQVQCLGDLPAPEELAFEHAPDVVLSNRQLPQGSGLKLLEQLPGIPLILLTDMGSIPDAVQAIRQGAADYLVRPLANDQLLAAIERACADSRQQLGRNGSAKGVNKLMLGRCAAMLELFDRITKVAPTESTVLIQGESGTGKELVARAIHANSRRQHAPMISLNCAAIPETLIESELFGHERGAFTGASSSRSGLIEAAHGGTLFLDEIGELPLEAQARLLRVLQEGEIRRVGATQTRTVDVRLIAATHRDLRRLASTGHFREDLFYRLNVLSLQVPPLRDRGEDAVELAQSMLKLAREKFNKPNLQLAPETLSAITRYSWPGNVRELENAIERAVILCETDTITPALLAIESSQPKRAIPDLPAEGAEKTSLEDYFVNFVLEHQDQLTETELAQKLGISRKSLWERRQRLNIPRKGTRQRRPRIEDSAI